MNRLRYLCALGLLAAAAAACGSSSGKDGGSAGSGATSNGGDQPLITIELPPDVQKRLGKLVDDLAAIVCQRSQNCCAGYGFRPLRDCKEAAGGIFVLRASRVLFDGVENFDFAIDETLATACLDTARAVVNDCTFASEPVFYAWAEPCGEAFRVTEKGETPPVCKDDDCTARLGPGQRCYADACLPLIEVATGSSCQAPDSPTSIPVCSASDYCNYEKICVQRAALGSACAAQDSCLEPYACANRVIDADTEGAFCAEKAPIGARCDRDDQCLEGACRCSPDVGCGKYVCAHLAHLGDACTTDDDCFGAIATCVNARCSPPSLSICEDLADSR